MNRRVSGIVVLAGFAALVAATVALRDVVVRDLLSRGVGPGSTGVPLPGVTDLPPLPEFPYESMEPLVQAQFTDAVERVRLAEYDAASNGELGLLFHAYGFHALAVPCYQRAVLLDLDDLSPRWRYLLGVALFERGEWARATTAFDLLLARRPDHVAVLLYRAETSRRQGLLEDAAAGYRRAMELEPQRARAVGGAGQVALGRGNLREAVRHLTEALRLAPEYGPARYALGQVLRRQDRLDDAARELRLARRQQEMEPPLDAALTRTLASLRTGAIEALHRGILLARDGRFAEAIPLFQDAIRIDPLLAEAHSQLGAARLSGGDTDAARRHLDRALELDPDFADARYNLGLVAHRLGRFEDAVGHFEHAVAVRPGHYDARLGLGTDLSRLGRHTEAIVHLRRAGDLRPDNPKPCKRLAAALSATGEFAEAVSTLRLGAERLSGDASIADRLAWMLATCPDDDVRLPAEALAIAEDVCRRTGQSQSRALATRAAALAGLGRFAEAFEVARQAHDLAVAGRRDELAAAIQRHLQAYGEGRAWIDD